MQKLYFMRHGETEDNAANLFSRDDTALTDNGRTHVRAAAEAAKAAGITIDLIITSPLPRAQESARIVAEVLGVDADHIEISNFARERDFGRLKGKPFDFFFDGTHVYKHLDLIAGVETVADLQDRALGEFQAISKRPENNILLVSHAAYGRAFMRVAKHIPYSDEYRNPMPHDTPPNGQIIELI